MEDDEQWKIAVLWTIKIVMLVYSILMNGEEI